MKIATEIASGLLLASFASALPAESLNFKIVGGEKVTEDLPWMTQLYSVVVDGDQVGLGQCGGTLISKDWVLTAAHCTLDAKDQVDESVSMPDPANPRRKIFSKYAFVGSQFKALSDLNPEADAMLAEANPISKVVCHPKFNPDTLQNDICLFKLSRPVNAEFVKLNLGKSFDEASEEPGSEGTVIGWGRTAEEGDENAGLDLKKATVPILPMLTCTRQFLKLQGVAFYSETSICAGGVKGIDTCQGDSGGPLTTADWKQIGITSFGFGCARANLPAAYTKVSSYQDWIEGVTGLSF